MIAEKKALMKGKEEVRVPEWFYKEATFCGLHKAGFLWWSNFWAMVFHLILATVSVVVSTLNGKTMATPRLSLYLTNISWTPNVTDALVPEYTRIEGLYLAHMVLWFFLLSALAHGTVVIFNYRQAYAEDGDFEGKRKVVTRWTGWYFINIAECRNPHRWIEYSFSASLMGMVFAVAGGINHLYMVLYTFGLLWATMYFGHVAEIVNRPVPPEKYDDPPQTWQMTNDKPYLLSVPELGAKFNRLLPNLLGYVPYTFAWFPLLHSFYYNSSDGQGAPDFVFVIIWSQVILFSCFGITQFILLWRDDGPSVYYYGELSYQVLSLLAKGVLGIVLMFNVLVYDSFDEAMANAD